MVETANNNDDEESANQEAEEAQSTPASASNSNAPTLRKAASINGLTVNLKNLTTDFIALGPAGDLDGDNVTVSVEISPSSSLLEFQAASNNIALSVDDLIQLASQKGALKLEVSATITD